MLREPGIGGASSPADEGTERTAVPEGPPRVSLLMAVHDGEAHLAEAIDSLLAQDFAGFQFVIVDDGSGPAAAAMLDAYARRDPRILLLRNPTCRGLPFSLNRGLAHCTAALTARADADDVYLPERLSRQIAFMDAQPEIGVVSCGWHRMDRSGNHEKTVGPVTDPDQIAFDRLFINRLLHPGAMFRTALVRAVGGYDPAYWTAQDSDLWARLADVTRLSNLPEPLLHYRVHPGSIMRRRGPEGAAMSLSVPARNLAAYLGEAVALAQVRAMVTLYQGHAPMTLNEAALGERGLARVHASARHREAPHVLATFERIVSDNLRHVAKTNRPVDRGGAFRLALRGLAWRFNHRLARRLLARVLARTRPALRS